MPIQSYVLLLPLVALWSLIPGLSPTIKMVAVSLSMFIFIKLHCLAIYRANPANRKPALTGMFLWVFAWAGLDPKSFFILATTGQGGHQRKTQAVSIAILKIGIGFGLLALIAPRYISVSPLLSGWIAMTGIVLFLHCGVIHFSSIVWNINGRPVKPIMNSPLLATTVSEFWSKRWNLAFRDYAHSCIFSPLARKTNGTIAVLAGFLFSGIIHDLAISVPAGGGYGWPTIYFAIQGIGSLLERRLKKSSYALSGLWTGRVWTAIWVAGPVLFLFHQPFVLNVIVPIVEWFGS